MSRYLLPLGGFMLLVILLGVGLRLDPRYVPSPLIDKPAPAFNLPTLKQPERTLSQEGLKGKVTLVNVWASWCSACRAEHALLVDISRKIKLNIVGLNYKDTRAEALQWLARYGDPYSVSVFDQEGRTGIDWGVYGVPETFVVDRQGIIRHKHIGPLTDDVVRDDILPLVHRLESAGT